MELTEEERVVYERLRMKPEEYPKASADYRECQECGAVFETRNEEGQQITAMQQFADHTAEHNPSPAQWTEAWGKIRRMFRR